MRLGVDVEVQLVAFLAPGGARLVFGAVGHHDRNVMIIRVNFGFHGISWGAARSPHVNGNGRIWRLYNVSRPPKQGLDGICQRGNRGLSGSVQNRMSGTMSAAEQLEDAQANAPGLPGNLPAEPPLPIETLLTQTPGTGRAKLRPLLALAPYVARYRARAFLAFIALTVAALTTLIVPIAVRRMIDFGFSPEGIAMIDSYFGVMIAVVAVLAGASASRHYLVMTIGERIVADLRRDVFAHLISLSPSFFDSARSGELISRLTADTTQIKSAVGSSVSIALRNLMLFVGATAMMVITSPRLSGFVLLAIPVIVIPLVAFGRWVRRLSRGAQDPLAEATAYASELVGAIRTVQAYTNERLANARFGGEVEQAYAAARSSTRARAVLTAIIIFIVFSSVVAILWIGSHDVLAGTSTPGRPRQIILSGGFAPPRPRPPSRGGGGGCAGSR